jgi:hypothetical protein
MWGKYGKYFDQWFDNLTDTQLFQYQVWSEGKMGPFPDKPVGMEYTPIIGRISSRKPDKTLKLNE